MKLSVQGLNSFYGPAHILFDVALDVGGGEVVALLDKGLRDGVTASRALGYAQVIEALDAGGGADRLSDAREQTYVGTRRYVRRQRSWFRRDHRAHWLDAADSARLVDEALRAWRHVS